MLEKWCQLTCDGCGETEIDGDPYGTGKKFRQEMKDNYGWKNIGRLDYCRVCVKNGKSKERNEEMVTNFEIGPVF